jgi:hypothetical protein
MKSRLKPAQSLVEEMEPASAGFFVRGSPGIYARAELF